MIAIDIFKDGGGAVRHPLGFEDELHTLGFELTGRGLHIVRPQCDVQLPAGLKLVAKLKQHDPRIGARNA